MDTTEEAVRPDFVTDEHLVYLDDLRKSGVTNMFGAARYLEKEYPELKQRKSSFHSSEKAQAVLSYWMKTFSQRKQQQ